MMMANTTRRAVLKAAPAVMVAPAALAAADDPILPHYRRWLAAREEFKRLSDDDVRWEDPVMVALAKERNDASERMEALTPVSQAGIVALMHVIWTEVQPYVEGSDAYHAEIELPLCKFVASAWRATSGETGLPTS